MSLNFLLQGDGCGSPFQGRAGRRREGFPGGSPVQASLSRHSGGALCSLDGAAGQLGSVRSGDREGTALLSGSEVRRKAPCGRIEKDTVILAATAPITPHPSQWSQNTRSQAPEPCGFGSCSPPMSTGPAFLPTRCGARVQGC